MALASAGILSRTPVFVGAALGVVALDQLLWYVDCTLKLLTGPKIIKALPDDSATHALPRTDDLPSITSVEASERARVVVHAKHFFAAAI